jgi:hypothetical protein
MIVLLQMLQLHLSAICYSVVNKYDGFATASGNFVVVYNTGSVLGDVGVEYAIDVMDNSIW